MPVVTGATGDRAGRVNSGHGTEKACSRWPLPPSGRGATCAPRSTRLGGVMAAGMPGRTTAAHRRNRAALKKLTHENNLPCALCGQPIDCTLPARDPMAFEYDHIKSIKAYPEIADDPANGQPSHKKCNGNKGAGDGPLPLGDPSEVW